MSLCDVEICQHVEVIEVLHAFCTHLGACLRRVSDDSLDESGFGRLGLDAGDERPIELDDVWGQRQHTLQPGIPLADVVDCDRCTAVAQRLQDQVEVVSVLDDFLLGDLELQPGQVKGKNVVQLAAAQY